MIINNGGDGTYLALVDINRYRSFVDHDWARDNALFRHLAEGANEQSIFTWYTGFETDWPVEISAGITNRKGFREATAYIRCTSDALHLVNYDDLTMAAQFEDHPIVKEGDIHQRVPLSPGSYKIRLVQMYDPDSNFWATLGDSPSFLLEYEPADAPADFAASIAWIDSSYLEESEPLDPDEVARLKAKVFPDSEETESLSDETADELIRIMNELAPSWDKTFVRFRYDKGSWGCNGSYLVGPEVELLYIDSAFSGLTKRMSQLIESSGLDTGLMLLTVEATGNREFQFDWINLDRWNITKWKGKSGLPEGI